MHGFGISGSGILGFRVRVEGLGPSADLSPRPYIVEPETPKPFTSDLLPLVAGFRCIDVRGSGPSGKRIS